MYDVYSWLADRYSHFLIVYGTGALLAGIFAQAFAGWWAAALVVTPILTYGWRHRDDENPDVHPELLDEEI